MHATVDVRPYGGPDGEDWFIVSDLGCAVGGAGGIGNREEGVVLGVGGASTTLAGITVRTPVGSALDLGTGSRHPGAARRPARHPGHGHRRQPRARWNSPV